VDLPTYTSIWRIEKRLYKLYDFRLPMPVPVGQIAVFAAITVPYVILLTILGLPFNHTLFWLYVLPPGVITWLATRPVLESKRLPELIISQVRYLGEPGTWCRMAPLAEKDDVVVVGKVWRREEELQRSPAEAPVLAPPAVPAPARHPARVRPAAARKAATAGAQATSAGQPTRVPRAAPAPRLRSPAEQRNGAPQWAAGSHGPVGLTPGVAREATSALAAEAAPAEITHDQRQAPVRPAAGPASQAAPAARPGPVSRPGAVGRPGPVGRHAGRPTFTARVPGFDPGDEESVTRHVRPEGAARPSGAAWPVKDPHAPAKTPAPADRASARPPWTTPGPPGPAPSVFGDVEGPVRSAGPAVPTVPAASAVPATADPVPAAGDPVPAGTDPVPAAAAPPPAAPPALPVPAPRVPGPAGFFIGLDPPEVTEDERAQDEPLADERAADEPAVDRLTQDEPLADGPAAPEVAEDERAQDEPLADGSATHEGAEDERAEHEAPGDELLADEPAGHEVAGSGLTEPELAEHDLAEPEVAQHEPLTQNAAGDEPPEGELAEPELAESELAEHAAAELDVAEPVAAEPVAQAPAHEASTPGAPAEDWPDEDWPDEDAADEEGADGYRPDENLPDEDASSEAGPPAAPASPWTPPIVVVRGGSSTRPTMVERALSDPGQHRAGSSWREHVRVVPGGHGPGRPDMERRDRDRVLLPIHGPRLIVVLGCTVGAGQSVTTLMLADVLATLRGEPVAALDLNPGQTSLAGLALTSPAATARGLLAGSAPIVPGQRGRGRLDLIAHDSAPDGGPALADEEYARVLEVLTSRYPLTLTDPGASAVARVLSTASQLVLVAPASADAARAVAMTMEWLDGHGYGELCTEAITVINGVSKRSMTHVEQAELVVRGRSRAIVRVPWDDHLGAPPSEQGISDAAADAESRFAQLRPQVQLAYTALAGVLVSALALEGSRTPPGAPGPPDGAPQRWAAR
jgi:MinD-like ATPase involved in chromosome partitioning or flagellar assembly